MSECCVEAGMLQALRALECTPIPQDQHFVGVRRGEECLPYVVVKSVKSPGLRTSDGVEMLDQLTVSAYFSQDKQVDATVFRDLLLRWAYSKNCLSLGDCGCICVRTIAGSSLTYGQNGWSVLLNIIGRFAAFDSSS